MMHEMRNDGAERFAFFISKESILSDVFRAAQRGRMRWMTPFWSSATKRLAICSVSAALPKFRSRKGCPASSADSRPAQRSLVWPKARLTTVLRRGAR